MTYRVGDQLLLRLPVGMKQRLQERADKLRCPMASVVIRAIEEHLDRPDILDRLDRLEQLMGVTDGSEPVRHLHARLRTPL